MVIFLIIIITWPMIRIDRPDDNAAIRGAIMKDSGSVHKNVQEMCDCYATTDPLKEMSTIKDEPDARSAALKWAALAALHGVGSNAEQITLSRSDDGRKLPSSPNTGPLNCPPRARMRAVKFLKPSGR
jgi:hypothetical protein